MTDSRSNVNGVTHLPISNAPILDLSAGFNEAACVLYVLESGLKYSAIQEIFRANALERTLPKLIDKPANEYEDDQDNIGG